MNSLIKKLSEAVGPSGYEGEVRSIIKEEIAPLVDDLEVDHLGNLIARLGQRANGGLKILLVAHMDEVGLIATHIDGKGFVRFAPMGDLHLQGLVGSRVRFLSGASGVIGSERILDKGKCASFDQMFIDLGVTDRAGCPVQIGDMAIIWHEYSELGRRSIGKALHNRVGVSLLIEALRQTRQHAQRSSHEFYFVFSAQEQIGSRGAGVAAYKIDPDVGLTIEVTPCGDTPRGLKNEVELGKGPAIRVRDSLGISDPRVVEWMIQTCLQNGIPYQVEIVERSSLEEGSIAVTRSGLPTGGLSLPGRYLHTPSEMIDLDDFQEGLNLLMALLSKPIEI